MTPAAAAAELEAFGAFYGALAAQQYWGEHVCCAVQPDDVHGSVDELIGVGVDDAAAITGRWAEQIANAVDDRSTVGSVLTALGNIDFDLGELARALERTLVQSAMLGALDSEWERENEEEIAAVRFAALQEGAFSSLPYADAVRIFQEKKVLPKEAFDALEAGAKKRAFTVAGMASQEMLNVTKAELAKQLSKARAKPVVGEDGVARRPGLNLREFKKFAKERLEKAGWTPANKSHVETVFRTNALGALSSGRVVEMRKPDVLDRLPYWQIRGVNDSRTRPTHKAAFNIVLRADHPFWKTAYPPFGYNCRCRVVARTLAWMKRNGMKLGPVPTGLPDPGFESGIKNLALPVPDKLEPKPVPVPVAKAPPAPAPVAPPPPLPAAPPPPPAPAPLPPVVPIAPPAPPVYQPPPVASAQNILGRKVSDATGSNPGGVYEGLDGKKRYVKFYTDAAQAQGEHIANKVYGELGFGKLESVTFEHDGKLAYASELLPGAKTLAQKGLDPKLAKKALDGFAADVLLANWDAAGLTVDNLVVGKGGKIFRIDNGGALLSRAKQGRKPLAALNNVTEWEKLFNPALNPGYAKLAQAAGVSSAEQLGASLQKGIKKILAVRKKAGGWKAFVAEHAGGLGAAEQQAMAEMLEARTSFLSKKLVELKKPPAPPPLREWSKLESRALPQARSRPLPVMSRDTYVARTRQRIRQHLDVQEMAAVESFTGGGYGRIRKAARLTEDEWVQASGATGTGEQTARAQYKVARAAADRIESAFEKAAATAATAPEAQLTELYRGIGGLPEATFDRMLSAKELVFGAPGSTSWNVEVAQSFADRQGGNRVVFVFRPKPEFASRRIAVEGVSSVGIGEAEVMARTGSAWRVTEVVQRQADPLGKSGKCAIVYCDEVASASGGVKLAMPGTSMLLSFAQTS